MFPFATVHWSSEPVRCIRLWMVHASAVARAHAQLSLRTEITVMDVLIAIMVLEQTRLAQGWKSALDLGFQPQCCGLAMDRVCRSTPNQTKPLPLVTQTALLTLFIATRRHRRGEVEEFVSQSPPIRSQSRTWRRCGAMGEPPASSSPLCTPTRTSMFNSWWVGPNAGG